MSGRWLFIGAVVVGATTGVAIAIASHHRTATTAPPARNWIPLHRLAQDFRLHDQSGRRLSLREFRGRDVILTFLDPVCRNLCPVEARVLAAVVRRGGADAPRVVAVSVNPSADTPANFRSDGREWGLPPAWRWATGSRAQLEPVWRAYGVAVRDQTRRVAGVTVREVAHTEEAYVVDSHGMIRALFIFPFHVADVEQVLRRLG